MLALIVLTAIATILGGLIGGFVGGVHRLQGGGGIFIRGSFVARVAAVLLAVSLGLMYSAPAWAWLGAALAAYFLSVKFGAYVNQRKDGL